jgi:iron complex outermembrane receptor protein
MFNSKPGPARKSVLGTVATVLVCLPALETLAQQIEEITVTARRYEERITDAPVAVAVMSSEFLRDNRVHTIQDVLELTPGADWDQFAKAQPGLTLRGIRGGAFGNASIEHAVSVVSDGVPITKAFMMTLPVYDQERIEVLRGPQGTTFGRNATLGMMHFIAARPSQEFSSHVEGSFGERDMFGVNGHIGGGLSDTVSGRFAFNYSDEPGPMDDETTGDPLDYAKNMSFRASLLFEPSDNFSAYLKAEYMDDEEFPTVRRGNDLGAVWLTPSYNSYVNNTDPWKVTLSPDPAGAPWIVERDMINLTAELTWNLGNNLALTSITGYVDGDHYSNSDAFGTPYDIRDQLVWNDASIFSQEFRIDNHGSDNRLRWLAGVSYLTDDEHRIEKNEAEPLRGNCNFTAPTACPRNSTLITDADNSTDAFGIFGEITYDLSDNLTLAVGGRYSDDSRDLVFSTYGWGSAGGLGGIGLDNPDPTMDCNAIQAATPGAPCGTEANPVGFFNGTVSDSWDNFSPKVSLSWAVNDTHNLYVLYSEGFKGGGFQQDARWLDALSLVLEPEEATNIELGWKGQTDRMIWAVTLFQQEQTDVHTGNLVAIGSSQSNLLVNAKGVENTGLELEGTFALTDNFTAGGTVAFYDPEFKSGTIINGAQQADGTITGGEDVSGTMPSYNVDFAYYLFAEYSWQLAGGSTIRLRGDVKHRDETWGLNGANNRAGLNLNGDGFMYLKPSITKPGLMAEWISAEENMSFSVWGRNLDDDPDPVNYGPPFGYVYLLGQSVNDSPRVRARASGVTGRRQIGATFRYNFD